ncbi:MAG: HEPN domain-containing protein [Planctomycetes bacterium]|nr:HEPN domain-containing protein [Planctomycetota bacterium]
MSKKDVRNWVDSAKYDLKTAEDMFNAGRYIYTVFMCHLALEKILKAKAHEITGKMPPKIHDLEYLLGLAKLSLSLEAEKFVVEISNLSIVTRYPVDFQKMRKDFSAKKTKQLLIKTKKVFIWINKLIQL